MFNHLVATESVVPLTKPMEDLGEALNPMQTEPDAAPVFSVNA